MHPNVTSISFVLPFVFVYHNSLLLIGSLPQIIQDIVTAAIAIVFLGSGFEGFMLKPLNILERALFIAGGALVLWPGLYSDIIGGMLLAVSLIWHIKSNKKTVTLSKIKSD